VDQQNLEVADIEKEIGENW